MNKLIPVFIILSFGLLSGCSTTQIAEGGPAQPTSSTPPAAVADATTPAVEAIAVSPEEANLPSVDMSGRMLNDLLLAGIAERRGHLDVAVTLYARLAMETRDPRIAERATRVSVFARENDAALSAAKLWAEVDPENLEARQLLTALYIRVDQPDEALVHIEKILASSQESSENGFMVVAGLLSREKDKRSALDLMRRFTDKRKTNPNAFYAYSHLAGRLGEWKIAEEAADQALALRPGWNQAVIQKAHILRSQGKMPQALEFMRQAVEATPASTDYRLVYARMLADEERLPEAYDQFIALNRLQPENDDALFALGFLALELGRLAEAEQYMTDLKRRGTRGEEVDYYMGRLAEEKGDDEAAKKWYGSITEGDHYINAQVRIIAIRARQNDLTGARAMLDSLRTQRPGQKLRLYLVEGELLAGAEQFAEAFELYTKALEEFADNADVLYARAMVAEKLDRLDEMEQDLRKVLARNPSSAEALNALGYTLADRTTRYDEAYDLVTRALELRPTDFFIVDSVGWVYYRLGRNEEALQYLRRAFELKKDADVAAHLGEVLWVMGNKEEARKVWQQALDANKKTKNKALIEVMERFNSTK